MIKIIYKFLVFFVSVVFSSCCNVYDDTWMIPDYIRNPKHVNYLQLADTSKRIINIYYPYAQKKDTNIYLNKSEILLPTNKTDLIIVETNVKTDSIWIKSEISITLQNSDFICKEKNKYNVTNNYSIHQTTADSIKIQFFGSADGGYFKEYGHSLILYQ